MLVYLFHSLLYYFYMSYTAQELATVVSTFLAEQAETVVVTDETVLTSSGIDFLVGCALFSEEDSVKERARKLIIRLADTRAITSVPTTSLYQAFQKNEVSGFTVPAINLRIMPYEVAHTIFTLMQKHAIGIVVFELARSEMGYSQQTPADLSLMVFAAAIKAGYSGAVFIQGDHYQVSKQAFGQDAVGELNKLKQLIIDSIRARLYNIDIDASTLVDLSQPTIAKQQEQNSIITAELTNFIRMHQPEGMEIMIGGEIGHIGDKNSTKEDMDGFMEQYLPKLYGKGIGKMSIQTGTEHGGNVDMSGKVQEMAVDMDLIEKLGEHARTTYQLAGVVQHGASTLPETLFSEFPRVHAVEIHLSTGIQNIVFDTIPDELRHTIYSWLTLNCDKERKPEWSDEQFYYRTRKMAIGAFKEQLWTLSVEEKKHITTAVATYLEGLFLSLGMKNTNTVISRYYA